MERQKQVLPRAPECLEPFLNSADWTTGTDPIDILQMTVTKKYDLLPQFCMPNNYETKSSNLIDQRTFKPSQIHLIHMHCSV